MSDGRRFEDKVGIEELMDTPDKELMARIYQQVLKTNGTVTQHCKDISELQTEMKEKISWKVIRNMIILLTIIISILSIPSLIFNIINLVVMK
uniref:Uncharacterized protein n=1 Tax=viral metagenome TaxID=1070528 RepID=A0A6H1ZD87_9ZZZZ